MVSGITFEVWFSYDSGVLKIRGTKKTELLRYLLELGCVKDILVLELVSVRLRAIQVLLLGIVRLGPFINIGTRYC